MRLWHTDLIPYLPNKQLISQWRELNSIYVKEDKHILINFLYTYDEYKEQLFYYSNRVIIEMIRRTIKIKNFENYKKYFKLDDFNFFDTYEELYQIATENTSNKYTKELFKVEMDKKYLVICCWNLFEKYIRGQTGFRNDAVEFIINIISSLEYQFTKDELLSYSKQLRHLNLIL